LVISFLIIKVIPLGFEGDYNILNTGFADMSPFSLAPLDFDFPNTCHNYAQLCR
jgi:hypothetical protein